MCVEHFAPPRILWIFALDDRRRFILLYFVLPVPTQFPHLRNHSCCTYRVEGCWRVFLMRRSLAPDDGCAGKGVFGGGLLCPALPCRFLSFALAYIASIHFAASENLRCVIYGTFSCFPPCLFYPPPPSDQHTGGGGSCTLPATEQEAPTSLSLSTMQSQDPMDNIRSAVEHADKNPSKVVSYSWYLVLVRKLLSKLLRKCRSDKARLGAR